MGRCARMRVSGRMAAVGFGALSDRLWGGPVVRENSWAAFLMPVTNCSLTLFFAKG